MFTDSTGLATRNDPAWFSDGLASCAVMAVFRGLSPQQTVSLATHAWNIGIVQVEVPMESAAAIPSLEAAIAAGNERGKRVGAGTIVTPHQLRVAVEAGAAYAVSPGLDPNVIALADRAGLPFLPGVATASEILRAQTMGFSWLKAFPASVLGVGWFAAMRGPFPSVNFVATGGLGAHNASAFLDAGAHVVGVGAALGDDAQREQLARIIATRPSLTAKRGATE